MSPARRAAHDAGIGRVSRGERAGRTDREYQRSRKDLPFQRSSLRRFAPVAAASAIALGALLGGVTASSDAPETVRQPTVASASLTDVVLLETGDNNGNG